MKKTFSFIDSKKNPERQADAIKHEVKKYMARERKKTLPEGVDYWFFDCKIGESKEAALVIKPQDINPIISNFLSEKQESFYLEILKKPGYKKKPGKQKIEPLSELSNSK